MPSDGPGSFEGVEPTRLRFTLTVASFRKQGWTIARQLGGRSPIQ
jgi:hypothetical protein